VTATPFERPPEETKRLARWAGAVYLSLGVATVFGFFHAPLVHDDLKAIACAITGPELRFRIGVVTDVLSTALAVPLGLLLYQLFKPVHKTQAALMALLLVAIPMSFVVALNYVAAAQMLLSGAHEVSAFTGAQRDALGMFFLRLPRRAGGGDLLGSMALPVRPARHSVVISAPRTWHSPHHRGRGVCRAQRDVATFG